MTINLKKTLDKISDNKILKDEAVSLSEHNRIDEVLYCTHFK